MCSVVDTPKPPPVYVRIHLGRREGAVAEQLLDRAEVGPALEQVRCERVPEPVRVGEDPSQRRRVQPPAAG